MTIEEFFWNVFVFLIVSSIVPAVILTWVLVVRELKRGQEK